MFDLVNDIEKYPEFLQWCSGARVDVRQGSTIEATLDIAVLGFQRSFRTRNTLRSPDRISLELVSGPFRRLRGEWRFSDRPDTGADAVRCRVLEGVRAARGRANGRLHAARGGVVRQQDDLASEGGVRRKRREP
jgi:hypothetical protein